MQPYNPLKQVWTLPISLATTFGISFDFFSLSYLDGSLHSVSPCSPILFKLAMLASLLTGYPIRLSPDLKMFALPRSFSQLTTAFIASQLLIGIHHKPIFHLTILLPLLSNLASQNLKHRTSLITLQQRKSQDNHVYQNTRISKLIQLDLRKTLKEE